MDGYPLLIFVIDHEREIVVRNNRKKEHFLFVPEDILKLSFRAVPEKNLHDDNITILAYIPKGII